MRANEGAPGIDSVHPGPRSRSTGVVRLLDELADELRQGRYRPLPARRVFIPKPGVRASRGRCRFLRFVTVIVQAAVKIVLEPVFEADMLPCSFGFRPKRGAHDGLQVLIDESSPPPAPPSRTPPESRLPRHPPQSRTQTRPPHAPPPRRTPRPHARPAPAAAKASSTYPDVQLLVDAGYQGLARDHRDQVNAPPLKLRPEARRASDRVGTRTQTPVLAADRGRAHHRRAEMVARPATLHRPTRLLPRNHQRHRRPRLRQIRRPHLVTQHTINYCDKVVIEDRVRWDHHR